MPDNRDQSRQKRSKENRAKTASVQARKGAVAKKDVPVEEPSAKGGRKTRAQAAPVRGSARTGGTAKTASTSGSSKSAPARPAPVEIDPSAPWIRRVLAAPGGRAVAICLATVIAVTVFVLVMSGPRTVERWDSKLEGREVTGCVTTDLKDVELKGRSAESVCGYAPDATKKYKDSDNRTKAQVDGRLTEIYGSGVLLPLTIPLLCAGVAFGLAARPNRRRIFGYCALMFGLWMFTMGLQFGVYYLVPFGALVFAWYQVRKADPPVRPERPAGGGGGLFGRRRSPDADAEVIDAEVVDEDGKSTSGS